MKSSEKGETIEQLIMTEKRAIKITISGEVLFEILKNVPTWKIIFSYERHDLSFLIYVGEAKKSASSPKDVNN